MDSNSSSYNPVRSGPLHEMSRNAIQEILRLRQEKERKKKLNVSEYDLTDDISLTETSDSHISQNTNRKRLVKLSGSSRLDKPTSGRHDGPSASMPGSHQNSNTSITRRVICLESSPESGGSFHSTVSLSEEQDDIATDFRGHGQSPLTESLPDFNLSENVDRDSARSSHGSPCEDPSETSSQEPVSTLSINNDRFRLPAGVEAGLYEHQKEGIEWMWKLHEMNQGGILGDDMGLGKTRQVASFLAGLFSGALIKRALLVLPATLLAQWRVELASVGLKSKTHDYTSAMTPKQRSSAVRSCFLVGGVLLTTYEMTSGHVAELLGPMAGCSESGDGWDYVILDEAHKVKNPQTKCHRALKQIGGRHVILMTGTPIQNNLKELWALFNLCCPDLLGDHREFRDVYARPIEDGNDKGATHRAMARGNSAAKRLRDKISPFFLRRTKAQIFPTAGQGGQQSEQQQGEVQEGREEGQKGKASLPQKNDLIVWLSLSARQERLYRAFLRSPAVMSVLNETQHALAALTVLKKICDHPGLLNESAVEDILEADSAGLGMAPDSLAVERMRQAVQEEMGADPTADVASCKIEFAKTLVMSLVRGGHRVLIFAQTRRMLDIVQEEVQKYGVRHCRIDGTLAPKVRETTVQEFQEEGSQICVFLLTTQVGGLGLTLTGADRVIIMDPSWNPSVDNQSVDRAYRIGQKRNVVIYRLVTAGTIEEKVYRKQIFKGGLMKSATEQKQQLRYFTHQELSDLFREPNEGFSVSETYRQLRAEHSNQRIMSDSVQCHLAKLERKCPGVLIGFTHHDLMFSKEAPQLPDVGPDPSSFARPPQSFVGRGPMRVMGGTLPRQLQKGLSSGWNNPDSVFGRKGIMGAAEEADDLAQAMEKMSIGPSSEAERVNAKFFDAVKRRNEIQEQIRKCESLKTNKNIIFKDGGLKLQYRLTSLLEDLKKVEAEVELHSKDV